MSNFYKYLDPGYAYIDPESGVLKNLQNITDPDVLLFIESSVVTKRLQELVDNPIQITGISSLFSIHEYLI